MSADDERDAMVMVSVRVPAAWLDRADRLATRLTNDDVLGRLATRTDVLRAAIDSGLTAIERKRKARR